MIKTGQRYSMTKFCRNYEKLSMPEFSEGIVSDVSLSTIMDIIFGDFLILYQIFFSPQVKRSVIISNNYGIYELPHELPNDLRLSILGN